MATAPPSKAAPHPQAPTPPQIGYATAPPEPGAALRIIRDGHHVEVIVPPLASWRSLPPELIAGIGILVMTLLWQAATALLTGRGAWRTSLGTVVAYAAVITIVLGFAYVRLHTWVRFVLTADRFFLIRRVRGMGETVTSWPRDRVLAATVSKNSGRLLLRILGQDTIELFIANDRAAACQVAHTLEAALHAPPPPADDRPKHPSLPPPAGAL